MPSPHDNSHRVWAAVWRQSIPSEARDACCVAVILGTANLNPWLPPFTCTSVTTLPSPSHAHQVYYMLGILAGVPLVYGLLVWPTFIEITCLPGYASPSDLEDLFVRAVQSAAYCDALAADPPYKSSRGKYTSTVAVAPASAEEEEATAPIEDQLRRRRKQLEQLQLSIQQLEDQQACLDPTLSQLAQRQQAGGMRQDNGKGEGDREKEDPPHQQHPQSQQSQQSQLPGLLGAGRHSPQLAPISPALLSSPPHAGAPSSYRSRPVAPSSPAG